VSPARLALVTILQFMENLTVREAAEAVRSRVYWKYLLGYDLTDPGFHSSVLSEFRARLLSGGEAILLGNFLHGFLLFAYMNIFSNNRLHRSSRSR
jgi:transposase